MTQSSFIMCKQQCRDERIVELAGHLLTSDRQSGSQLDKTSLMRGTANEVCTIVDPPFLQYTLMHTDSLQPNQIYLSSLE